MIKTYPKKLYRILPCLRSEVKDFVESHHYSKNINGLKISQCFKVLSLDNLLVGAVIFGQLSTTSWKKYGKSESEVLELRRLVLLDQCEFNTESFVIASCLRYLKKHTNYKVVISYADPYHGHSGVVYRASNFEYLGCTASDTLLKDPDSGKLYHSRAMRTKYNGKFKPFAVRLQQLNAAGLLEKIIVPGKHIYRYILKTS
jgi:hypothetical protein